MILWHIQVQDHGGMINMQIRQLGASRENSWDEYVEKRTSTVTDLAAWRHVLHDTYGIESHFLAVEESDAIVGTLGLYEIRHPVFGHYLTTAAFSTDGGFFYDNENARTLLIQEARRLADEKEVDYLLVRSRQPEIENLNQDRHYQTALIDLQPGVDAIWEKTLKGKTRNQVRRGIKEGFTISTGHDQMQDFHQVFHTHMRHLGSPVHGPAFYSNIIRYLGERARFIVVRDGDKRVAGALLFEVNGTAMNLHTVSLTPFNRRCPNYLLYWEMIKGSCERGNRFFDMGRSEANSSNLKFKLNWGAQAVGLNYNYYLRKSREVPYVDPRNPRYRLPIEIWKRLPFSVTGKLGPWLIRGIA